MCAYRHAFLNVVTTLAPRMKSNIPALISSLCEQGSGDKRPVVVKKMWIGVAHLVEIRSFCVPVHSCILRFLPHSQAFTPVYGTGVV